MSSSSSLEKSISKNGTFPRHLLNTNPGKRNSFSSALNQTDSSFGWNIILSVLALHTLLEWIWLCSLQIQFRVSNTQTYQDGKSEACSQSRYERLYIAKVCLLLLMQKIRTRCRALISVVPECTARCTSRGWLARCQTVTRSRFDWHWYSFEFAAFPVGFVSLTSFVLPPPLPYLLESKWFQPKLSHRYSSINWFMGIRKNFHSLIIRSTLWLSSLGKKPSSCSGKNDQRSFFSFSNKQLSLTLNWRTCLGVSNCKRAVKLDYHYCDSYNYTHSSHFN